MVISYPRILSIGNALAYTLNSAETFGFGPFSRSFSPGQDNASISQKYQTIITPAGAAFSIWGLIFAMQAANVLTVLLAASDERRDHPLMVRGVAWNYVAVCIAQTAWSPAFAYERIPLSAFFMGCILLPLATIVVRQRGVMAAAAAEGGVSDYDDHYWLLRFPFEVHLGWIMAAFAVNLNVAAVASGAGASAQVAAAAASLGLLALASVACLLFSKGRPNHAIPSVIAWATLWISVELRNPKASVRNTFDDYQIGAFRKASGVTCGILTALTLLSWIRCKHLKGIDSSKGQGEGRPLKVD